MTRKRYAKGFSATGLIIQDPEKAQAWQERWEREHAHRWVERNGLLFPAEVKP